MKSLIIALLLSTSTFAANQKAICGKEDNRTLSYKKEVGRVLETLESTHGCTMTMVGPSCALSAGHCVPILNLVEFNTPTSIDSILQHSADEDIYEVDKASIVWSKGFGTDYAVFKLHPNSITQELAGNVQGFLNISYAKVKRGTDLKMFGHGTSADPQGNHSQQLSLGTLKKIKSSGLMYHKMDATSGSSGSAILLADTGEIIGIHTHNGCKEIFKSNRSTAISKNIKLQQAIKDCLQSEK